MSWLFTSGGQSIGAPALTSVLPMNLISFRIDWFDLLTVQGTFKSLSQHHNSKASILQCSAFFMVQVSHQYMTAEKTIPLTIQTFVRKGKSRNSDRFYFLGLQNHSDLPEIKRYLLLGRKAITNLDSVLKSRDTTLQTKFCMVKRGGRCANTSKTSWRKLEAKQQDS